MVKRKDSKAKPDDPGSGKPDNPGGGKPDKPDTGEPPPTTTADFAAELSMPRMTASTGMLGASTPSSLTVPQEITAETLAANSDINHPLPVFSMWSTSTKDDPTGATTYAPAWQLGQLAAGRHIVPAFHNTDPSLFDSAWVSYFQASMESAEAQGLPLMFTFPNPEREAYTNPAHKALPYAQNACAWVGGVAVDKLSPCGAIAVWQAIGTSWGASATHAMLEGYYPTPPRVIYAMNNEASKLQWFDCETDQHYLDLHGTGQTDNFKRQVFAEGFRDRFRAMQAAWKAEISTAWASVLSFVGYEAMGPADFGVGGWTTYYNYYPANIGSATYPFDGGSPSYYMWDVPTTVNDYTVYGSQTGHMNYNFMFPQIYGVNASFWYEFSTWTGINEGGGSNNYDQRLAALGQTYSPARYAGWCQFAMWLNRPRAVRDYHNEYEPRSNSGTYTTALMDAVDRVYTNATLKSFWRNSTLVANTAVSHPWNSDVPSEYASAQRMFMLTTNLDPALPWSNPTEIPVFCCARVTGTTPNRQWLVYLFSPKQNRTGVVVTIPSYANVTVTATIAGVFYLVSEAGSTVTLVA